MNISKNALLEWNEETVQLKVERVLRIGPEGIWTIRLFEPKALPVLRDTTHLTAALTSGECVIVKADPYSRLLQPESELAPNYRDRRDRAWGIIQLIVEAPDDAALNPKIRGQLTREAMRRTGKTKAMIYRYLRRYWQFGQSKNALLPFFENCGAKGKDRVPGDVKRGRPNRVRQAAGLAPGINIGPEERDKFKRGIRLFFENRSMPEKLTLREAHDQTLRRFFHAGYKTERGTPVPVLPPLDELPTFRQFEYWYQKDKNPRRTIEAREGKRRYQLKHRPVLGDSTQMAFGPGSIFQIDSTTADIYLVSALVRNRTIERPTLYIVVDVFTHLIVGFTIALEEPSYLAAALALENSASDKVAFCSSLGIEIDEDEWPCAHLPEMLLADRGELEGPKADPIVNALNIRISNTPPYRADLKGIVERKFRSLNDEVVHWLPGHVNKTAERGDRDYRLDAVLDIHQFRKLVALTILDHNRSRIESYRLDEAMMADGVEPRPVALWKWGIQNRAGHLRQVDPSILRMSLLPTGEASVTAKGIRFKGVFYCCERAVREQWFVRARTNGSWRVSISYDPRCIDVIYLRGEGMKQPEACLLVEADERFKGGAWVDIEDVAQAQKEQRELTMSSDRQRGAAVEAQKQAIVAEAKDQTALHQTDQSKRSRIQGIRENSRNEKLVERARETGNGTITPPEMSEKIVALPFPNASPNKSGASYVAPLSPLEMLKKQREHLWSTT
jgi:putative transposase